MLSGISEDLVFLDLENIEVHGLGQRSALSNSGNISLFDSEARRAVGDDVGVSLLVPVVLLDVVEVVPSEDNGVSHLVGDDHSLDDLSSDGDVAREGALLVYVVSLDGLLWGLEAKADVLVVSGGLFVLGDQHLLGVGVDSLLLLIAVLSLFNHVCDL